MAVNNAATQVDQAVVDEEDVASGITVQELAETTQSFAEMLQEELGYTSSSTYVSTPATFIDLPEPTSFKSEFFYNYYTKDERTVSTGAASIVNINSTDQDIEFIKSKNRMPRSVILKVRGAAPVDLPANSFLRQWGPDEATGDYISENQDKIVFEGAVANGRFSSIFLRDNQVDETFYEQITGSIAFDNAFSKSDTHSQFLTNLTSQYFSPMTSAAQSPSTLRKAMSNAQPNGVAYAPTDARVELIAEAMRDVRFVEFGLSVNHAVIGNVVLGSVEDMGNIYQDELLGILGTAGDMQQRYVEEHNPAIVQSSDFEIEMAPIHTVVKSDAKKQGLNIDESSWPVGYYIEKTEMSSDGQGGINSKVCDPIIINKYGDFNIFDSDIKYGATYLYNCRIIYLTAYESTAIDPNGEIPDESIFAISIIASNGIKTQVSALENIPPGPPQNLRFNYNFYDNGLDLFWEEPMNPQRDVMRYQIFRREHTSQSFVLLAELDFDHSTSRVVPLETAPPEKLIRVRGPRKTYKDTSFSREGTYIYAMASIDARGLTSGYSEQVAVRFDKFKNKIERNRVSPPGAPKSYPNLYLKGDFFVDTMNSSGASRMRVFFDPEYYDVLKDNTIQLAERHGGTVTWPSSMKLLGDQYKLQMINLDLQNVQTLDIGINDETGDPLDVPLTEATIKSVL
tara:strand:+ start:1115 stop:3157 length:2043 start_codon:yes stop_codon:yes gene_type:complete